MEFINPRLTIENTAGAHWLVRMEHRLDEEQSLDIRLALPRSMASVPTVQLQLLKAARARLTLLIDSLEQSTAIDGPSP